MICLELFCTNSVHIHRPKDEKMKCVSLESIYRYQKKRSIVNQSNYSDEKCQKKINKEKRMITLDSKILHLISFHRPFGICWSKIRPSPRNC